MKAKPNSGGPPRLGTAGCNSRSPANWDKPAPAEPADFYLLFRLLLLLLAGDAVFLSPLFRPWERASCTKSRLHTAVPRKSRATGGSLS